VGIARQLDAIATEILGPAHGVVEELVADSGAALIRNDVHRFDLGTATATMLEVAEREELQHADDAAAEFGNQQVRAISPVDFAQRIDVVVDVIRIVSTLAGSAVEKDVDESFDISVESISEVQLHGRTYLQI